ncbi:cyclic nucleotide-binding domain-containing protein [Cecembia sp.]|uniref:Crp/Fnr family transcriptional regulator n=1 Tax=Cecembia sp. TaxID=1898110 RepID=UPI00344B34F3
MQVWKIGAYFEPHSFKKNEYVLWEGEVCQYNYFVISGCMRVFIRNKDGIANTRYIAFEGMFCTCFTSLITGEPSFKTSKSHESHFIIKTKGYSNFMGPLFGFLFSLHYQCPKSASKSTYSG